MYCDENIKQKQKQKIENKMNNFMKVVLSTPTVLIGKFAKNNE